MNIRRLWCGLKNLFALSIFGCIAINLLMLLYNQPKKLNKPCPYVISSQQYGPKKYIYGTTGTSFDCASALHEAHSSFESFKWCKRQNILTESDYLSLTRDCKSFIQNHRYSEYNVDEEEKEFPLAFSILLHEHVEQAERLLRAVYRPHNFYCLHVDAKAPISVHNAVAAIASCMDNVKVASTSVQVHWAEISVLDAELVCLKDLWNQTQWKYYLNLGGSEFPLKTNKELVQILKAYNGGNEVDGSIRRRPIEWTKYSWRKEFWRTNNLKSPPPHGINVAKGSTHVALSRRFVDFALHDNRSQDLLQWMSDIRVPDEHFFPTLNNNPQLGAPGAYTGDPDLRDGFYVRYKRWESPQEECHGKWVHHICVLATGDISAIYDTKHMFVNKLDLDLDPVAYQCAEQWYYERVRGTRHVSFVKKFYEKRKLVKHHV